ncbi:urea carboxylase [Pantoea piersonii]|jgi:urea carboxylase|uniref:urea carboxylase n=1 Tax=Pantoea piersonii TaxID=2364647 RepID=UPI000EA1B62B|nr:urea carboxylase [Pantoea piersonii]MBZ6384596.1 urea carboxylase [Pantoea piersonii]MBZ6398231.1 urea carboxylase [Pantoea piersonii]MBZ6406937.1 urea carboxylase [Pantoea piersonii]MBZ6425216.1 urea carboxylase [Pantoea piersonii]NYB01741.1 urea carboxylase [Pantoea piersonii]
MFSTVLIANRGEIACRAIRTLKRLGVKSVAVYSDVDRNARHVKEADVAIALEGEKASDSYLCIDKILAAAQEAGAEAIWPGYGFLSESQSFATACEEAGITFVGPTAQQIGEFGLKHRARELAASAGVPMTPGTPLLTSLEEAINAAEIIGYPVMLKSTAGGGGIGLNRCADEDALRNAWESVRRLGEQFFSDAGVFLERCIDRARHVEVQIFGDGRGKVVALGERDCSLQRRNQKVVEETPAPNLPAATRAALLASAVRLGERVGYRSAGTVEYIYDAEQDRFYFLEVNTRLQVEHPVTECVTGLDLVECMLQVAAGDAIDWTRLQKAPNGASIEVRIYAEDPLKNFQPSPGVLTNVTFPDDVRIDSWIDTGTEVSAFYDPMIAKVIVHADTREAALKKMQQALGATQLHGIATNLDYLRQVVATEAFHTGDVWTRFLDSFTPSASVIEVLKPGTFSTIQDFPGRLGYWDIGVPPSGPMDDLAFRLANRIVGNHESAAGLELTLQGPTLRFHSDAVIALTGADCPADLDGESIHYWQPVTVKAGQTLTLGRARSGCRTYLAVRNGFDVPEYLGSRSTFSLGQFGGHAGRTLRVADMLPISQPQLPACTTPAPVSEPQALDDALVPHYGTVWRIGVVYGPHGAPDFFTQAAIDEFFSSDWQVHYNSNRLGVRLVGPKPGWARADGGEAGLHPSNVHDCEYAIGAVNFTGDFPVILTHDGPSLGGFVCPVTIAKAELWKVGQVKPGDRIRFHPISVEEAVALEKAQTHSVETLRSTHVPAFEVPSLTASPTGAAALLAALPATATTPAVVYRQAGDKYVLIEYGDNVLDLALRLRVHLLMNALRARAVPGVEELAPGVRSLQVRYDSLHLSQQQLMRLLLELEAGLGDVSELKVSSRIVWMPMAFEDSATLGAVQRYKETVRESAPWLPNNVDFIQRINGLESREAVRDTLFDASYLILGLGDVYLGAPCAVPVDPRHRLLSSKYSPARTFTAEGTVGIGGMYMCIYGMDSPGGYQLVGRTLPIWNKFLKNDQFLADEPWLLRFFDQVRFYPVSEEELTQLRDDFREGRAAIRIEETIFDFAAHQQFLTEHADSIAAFRQRQAAAFEQEVTLWAQEEESTPPSATETLVAVEEDEGAQGVCADMNGNIWKVLVQPGDTVEAGQTLIIVEAMKMELAIVAPQAGTVKRIACQAGRPVSPGDTLLWLEQGGA